MSWREAPLYVEAHDLARWIGERSKGWPADSRREVGAHLIAAACELLTAVGLALTFPHSRRGHLETADAAIVRCRLLLRLARDLCLVSPGGNRFAAGRLAEIGRMVGGWQKQVERSQQHGARRQGRACHDHQSQRSPGSGDGPPPAGGA